MQNIELINMSYNLIKIVLMISLPPIIIASLVGVTISLIQALTQIQEQTISFAFKLIAVMLTIMFLAPWMATEIYNFALNSFTLLSLA